MGRKRLVIERSGEQEFREGVWTLKGGVKGRWGSRLFQGEGARVDTRLNTLEVTGEGLVNDGGEKIAGEMVRYDLTNRSFSFANGEVRLSPQRIGGGVRGPLFVKGADFRGTDLRYEIRGCGLTTCEHDHPHYELTAGYGDIVPGRQATLYDVRLRVLGRTWFRVPALTVPLTQGSDRFLPQVGQSPDEGYFVKARFGQPVGDGRTLDFLTDAMSKLGLGLGAAYAYFGATEGAARLYGVFGRNDSRVLSWNHRQRLGGGTLNLDTLWQQSLYLNAPDTTVSSLRGLWSRTGAFGSTTVSAFRSGTQTAGFRSANQNLSVSDQRTWGGAAQPRTGREARLAESLEQKNAVRSRPTRTRPLTTRVDVNWFGSENVSGSTRSDSERLDLKLNAQRGFEGFDAEFAYERAIPISGGGRFLGGRDRTPFLGLTSDLQRLGLARGTLRSDLTLSVAELTDPGQGRPITRWFFEGGAGDGLRGGGRLSGSWSGRFRQGLYSDDTAQYVLSGDARLAYTWARGSSFEVTYRTLKSDGFTPLSLDRTGRTDQFSFGVRYQASRSLNWSVQSGYDVLNGWRGQVPWQTVSVLGEYERPDVRARLTSTYDPFVGTWSFARLDMDGQWRGARFSAGIRYDARRSTWAGANVFLGGLRIGKTTVSTVLDYNGYTKRIESQQWQLAYDLHCVEAVLEVIDNRAGFRAGRTIGLFVRIKALPSGDPFGIGRRGQSVGGLGG